MNPFLKKEWNDTEIPERVYREARDRAWAQMHAPPSRAGRRLAWAMATLGLATGAVFLVLQSNQPTLSPEPPSPRVTTAAVNPPAEQHTDRGNTSPTRSLANSTAARQPARRLNRRLQAANRSQVPDRLVLNFVLPESGVRMIWIMDKDFQLHGEIE